MHRPGNRIVPGLRPAARPHHASGPAAPPPVPPGWHTAFAERLRGPLDPAALHAAFVAVATRQDVLRYRFSDGVVEPPGPVPLTVADLPAGALDAHLADLAGTPFDPAGRLWRAALYRLAPDEHVLAFAGHRAVFDDRTQALLYAELAGAWRNGARAPLGTTFAGYVGWRASRVGRSDLRWWSAHLEGTAPRLALPSDDTGAAAGHASLTLDPGISAGIGGLARGFGATPAAVLLAALGVVLARLSGQRDFAVGTPMVGPRSPAFEPLLGALAEIAPLRLRPDPELPFGGLVLQVRDELLEALAHPAVGPAAATQVLFETVDAEPPALDLPGLAAVPVPVPIPTPVELTLRCLPHGDRLRLAAGYAPGRYLPERIAALLSTLGHVLAQAVASPGTRVADFALRPDDQPAPDRDQTVVDRVGRRTAVGELGEIVVRWAGGWLDTGRAGRYRPDGTVESAETQDSASVRALETGRT